MRLKTVLLALALIVLIMNVASTCPVCYGETDVHTASAVNAAIYSLLIVTGTVLSFFASLIVYLRKRMKLSSTADSNQLQ